jgi:ribose 5-phosphate isomerase A
MEWVMAAQRREQQEKHQAAQAALGYLKKQVILGVGTGSTVACFIDALGAYRQVIKGCVPSSRQTERLLQALELPVLTLNEVDGIDLYIDGVDEIDAFGHCIKGGGAALTREKILAHQAAHFICIADSRKRVKALGRKHALPIEVLDFARSALARQLSAWGGAVHYRQGVTTDNGHVILDVMGLDLTDVTQLDARLNSLPGVVAHGLFIEQKPQTLLLGVGSGVEVISFGGQCGR